jgi:hypothetical protein
MIESLLCACTAIWLAYEALSPNLNSNRRRTTIPCAPKTWERLSQHAGSSNTGQSASLITLAVVEPSSICRNLPACEGIMMRSNLSSLAIRAISVAASREIRIQGYSATGNSPVRKELSLSRQMLRCSSKTSVIGLT